MFSKEEFAIIGVVLGGMIVGIVFAGICTKNFIKSKTKKDLDSKDLEIIKLKQEIELNDKLSPLEKRFEKIENKIESLKTGIKEDFHTELNNRIDQLETNMDNKFATKKELELVFKIGELYYGEFRKFKAKKYGVLATAEQDLRSRNVEFIKEDIYDDVDIEIHKKLDELSRKLEKY